MLSGSARTPECFINKNLWFQQIAVVLSSRNYARKPDFTAGAAVRHIGNINTGGRNLQIVPPAFHAHILPGRR